MHEGYQRGLLSKQVDEEVSFQYQSEVLKTFGNTVKKLNKKVNMQDYCWVSHYESEGSDTTMK